MRKSLILPEKVDVNEVSNGSHTFNELYSYIELLFIGFICSNSDKAWKTNKNIHGIESDHVYLGVDLGNLGNLYMHMHKIWDEKISDGLKKIERVPAEAILDNDDRFYSRIAMFPSHDHICRFIFIKHCKSLTIILS